MTNVLITGIVCLVLALACIGYDIYTRQFCKHCGSKMDRYYDIEEDAEVYQCPNCGRSYLIN